MMARLSAHGWLLPIVMLLQGLKLASGGGRVVCTGGQCFSSRVKVVLENGQGMLFCRLCRDAREEGMYIDVWEAHFRPPDFSVVADLVYAVPNDASSDLLNHEALRGNVALIDRGNVPIVSKIKRAQTAGATGVVIVDNGDCDSDFECDILGSRGSGAHKQGWSAQDHAERWRGIKIPSVVVIQEHGDGLKDMMELETMQLGGLGAQRMEVEL
eukprot:g3024.t1